MISLYEWFCATVESLVAINTLFKHFLQSDWPQLSSARTKLAEESTRANFQPLRASLYEPVASCSEQTANQNTNIAEEVCKAERKRTFGLSVKWVILIGLKTLSFLYNQTIPTHFLS